MVAFCEVGLDHEAEEFLLGFHLEYWGVVVSDMLIGTLPKVGTMFCDHLYGVTLDRPPLGLSRPFEIVDVQCHDSLVLFNILLAFAFVFFARAC